MISPPITRFQDIVNRVVPVWLRDRGNGALSVFNVGYRILWTMAATLDALEEQAWEGVQAAWPGVGDPTALPYIGRTRGIVQGLTETNDHYAARLVSWFEAHAADRALGLATQLHEYVGHNPMVRIVERRDDEGSQFWTTVAADGTVSTTTTTNWDWDSVSNPERADFWSEMWIIIYTDATYWARRPGTLGGLPPEPSDDGNGLGLLIPHGVADTVRKIISDWKSQHERVRAVLFTSNVNAYDPLNPHGPLGIWPDGTWGQWGLPGSNPYVAGGRDLTVTRYMEPNG